MALVLRAGGRRNHDPGLGGEHRPLEDPQPAPSIAPIASPALDRVLKICLEKDPDDRWQSVRDLKRELEWIAAAPGPGQTPVVRSKTGALWATIAALALVSAAGVLVSIYLLVYARVQMIPLTASMRWKNILASTRDAGWALLIAGNLLLGWWACTVTARHMGLPDSDVTLAAGRERLPALFGALVLEQLVSQPGVRDGRLAAHLASEPARTTLAVPRVSTCSPSGTSPLIANSALCSNL